MDYYLAVWKKYAAFKGRATRTEYWMFAWINLIFGVIAFILDIVFRTSSPIRIDLTNFLIIDLANFMIPFPGKISGFFLSLYFLAVFVPFLAVTVRRLHDTGTSGWWCLLQLIPLVGTIWLIVLLATAGSREENTYGPAPAETIRVDQLPQQRVSD